MRPLVDGLPPAHSIEEYDDQPNYVLALCYPAGVGDDDAELTVISGSHLHRDPVGCVGTEAELRDGWARYRRHPISGEAMSECFHTVTLPPGSIVCLLSHCAHGVRPKPKSAKAVGRADRPALTTLSRPFLPRFPPFFRRSFALSGFLAPRRRKWAKNGAKWAKNGQDRRLVSSALAALPTAPNTAMV